MLTYNGGPAFPMTMRVTADAVDGKTTVNEVATMGMSLRDYFAAKAMNATIGMQDREWFPEFQDLVEDENGGFQYNPDTKTVYRVPTAYSINKSHKRYREANTWMFRMAREAYRIADAMLAAREVKP